jgi:hypothetical protein
LDGGALESFTDFAGGQVMLLGCICNWNLFSAKSTMSFHPSFLSVIGILEIETNQATYPQGPASNPKEASEIPNHDQQSVG